MSFAFVVDGQVKAYDITPPLTAFRPDGVEVVVRKGTSTDQRACGFYVIQQVPPPAINSNQRNDRTVQFIGGEAVEVWTTRAATTPEITQVNRKVNLDLMTDSTDLTNTMNTLKEFLSDPDIQVLLDQPNNTALTTQQVNRGFKAIVRQLRRNANFSMRQTRVGFFNYNNQQLLDDISDTTVT